MGCLAMVIADTGCIVLFNGNGYGYGYGRVRCIYLLVGEYLVKTRNRMKWSRGLGTALP